MLDWLLTIDAGLFLWVNELPHPTSVTRVMQAASVISTGSAVWLVLAGVLAFRGDPAGAFRTALAVLVTAVVTTGALKPLIGRDRPADRHPEATIHTTAPPASTSFPSGHAAGAAAGAYALSRFWAARSLWGLAVLIATSRVYLGLHYPSDMLAGIGVGLACAYFVTGGLSYRRRSDAQAGPDGRSGGTVTRRPRDRRGPPRHRATSRDRRF